ncbi:lignin-forming anionic peroxidase-like [Salvia hispanica]|uniref:lignin-forming anionic peroxidase-like n=1 Tax=Salvia hispanica TaxID=49212 RepID=UPI002009528F|nr:lignin-forming anionic peroxidase-like [Salvia hispanica]
MTISSNHYYYFATLTIVLLIVPSDAQLSSTFYDITCADALSTIRLNITRAVANEQRMAASLIRLHFLDCFVQGCDASILLEDESGERAAVQNANSVRGFEVVEAAKQAVEAICPGVVSCADVLAVAARDATVAAGGPSWIVNLGRRDSPLAATIDVAENDLPRGNDPLQTLITKFANKNLNQTHMVALSGAKTIGQARCVTFRDRIYNTQGLDPEFVRMRQSDCPQTGGDDNLAPLDEVTPTDFDNNYFRNLQRGRGLLESDQVLFSQQLTNSIAQEYINSADRFKLDFAAAMIRMGDIQPLTGANGLIRSTCASSNN